MKRWKLGLDGYIMQYMIAGPRIQDYSSDTRAEEQLALEAKLRAEIVTQKPQKADPQIKMGQPSGNGCSWTVSAAYGNSFIDVSSFYSTLQKIELDAAAALYAPRDMQVKARVWTYMAVGVYLNGTLLGEVKRPVYKPIQYLDVVLSLKEGRNLLYFKCENLGVRDTRDMLGVQIREAADEIEVALPDENVQDRVYEETAFLSGMSLENGKILFPGKAPENLSYCRLKESPDYEVMREAALWEKAEGASELEIPRESACVTVRIQGEGYEMRRTLEFAERRVPEYKDQDRELSFEENFRAVMERIAAVGSLNRGGKFGFAISNILARKYLGIDCPEDRERMLGDLALIHTRVDCSDFLMCGILRYMHLYELDEEMAEKVKETFLDYRYWMDMEGADAMCFWSENHALMFYAAAMDAGSFYPDDYFHRASMTGRELSAFGRGKVLEWLEDVEQNGFEEFLSTVYMCVTFAVLLNVIDFSEPEISRRASVLADRLVRELSLHTFRGGIIAPMGRVYREAIYPFRQGALAITHLINPQVPVAFGEGWLAYMTGSSYHFPEGLKELMSGEKSCSYQSGNAVIHLEKNQDYCLTSVESPRQKPFTRWPNVRGEKGMDPAGHAYTRSLNESFHGTTCFQPGIYGYQQHMWYGALSPEAVVFANHPGTYAEQSSMRPGYWYGNGVMPALKQIPGMLGAIYDIPDSYPVQFIHVYCPSFRFDECVKEENWLFLRKDEGYLALWTSGAMEPYSDMIFNCEYRIHESSVACICVCGRKKDYATLQDFADYARSLGPVYHRQERKLSVGKDFELVYCPGKDRTQIVD